MILRKIPLPFLLLFLQITACDKDDTLASGSYKRGDLIETVEKGTLTKDEVVERVTELPADGFAQHGVS